MQGMTILHIVTDVVWSAYLSVCVCLLVTVRALQKWMNKSRCHLDLGGSKEPCIICLAGRLWERQLWVYAWICTSHTVSS